MKNISRSKKQSKALVIGNKYPLSNTTDNKLRSIVFMNNLLAHPNKSFDYARLYASSVAAVLAWGFRAKDFDSFFYKDFYDFVDQASKALTLPHRNA
jgi:hypothetical protein